MTYKRLKNKNLGFIQDFNGKSLNIFLALAELKNTLRTG
jgi:hypothetical protein